MLISFINDADIKTISEFKESFGKYYPVFPKKLKCKKCLVFDPNFRGKSA
jgi:hypothetical protein